MTNIYDIWTANAIHLQLDWEFLIADKQLSFRANSTNTWATTCKVNSWKMLPITNNWVALSWWEIIGWEMITLVVNPTLDWFKLYPEINLHNKWYFATALALTTAYPTAVSWDYAIVWATDTVWTYDADTLWWKDSWWAWVYQPILLEWAFVNWDKTKLDQQSWVNSWNETATTIWALIGWSGDATPNDTDFVATSLTLGWILKKITWTNVKVFLKTYFDTLYANISGSITQSFWASTIELWHATDTTISRVSAGKLAVEWVTLLDTTNISDTAYWVGWDLDTTNAPSKNVVYDEMELKAPKVSPTFSGITTIDSLVGTSVSVTAWLNSSGATGAGIGYITGAGWAVTQITSRTTGVTLDKLSGTITTDITSLAAEATADFIVTNSTVAATDTVIVSVSSGSNSGGTIVTVTGVAAGSFTIRVHNGNVAAWTAETGAIKINFSVIKAVAA